MNAISPYLIPSQRFRSYNFQMYQASLRAPIIPISSHSFQSLYSKQQQWSQDTSAKLSQYIEQANQLAKETRSFDSEQPNSLINMRLANSSNKKELTGSAQPKASMASYSIEVAKLASKQQNTGSSLNSSAPSSVQTGKNSFRLNVGGQEHTISFEASNHDSNLETLTRMASAINQSESSLTARVIQNHEQNTSTLELSSNETGLPHAFSIFDVEGNSVQASGIGTVTQAAEDAQYKVNGKNYSSSSNTVTVGDAKDVTVFFHQVTSGPVTLEVTANASKLVSQVKSLIHQYNQFNTYIQQEPLSKSVIQSWNSSTQRISSRLNDIGVDQLADGRLYVDDQKLEQNLQDHFAQIQSALSGPDGVATLMSKETRRIQQTPLVGAYPLPSLNPYTNYLLPNLFIQQASATGLYLNQAF
ncbi:flagellar filament capping protein FliD [Brevibacillus ginsengisoli]|uniref:flagellar filament capping protein FliD n=1 Tax=Brevibacillus ginsengisoli TaxID=363854 RepID=UPI003CF66E66